jgi:hypothetical protein
MMLEGSIVTIVALAWLFLRMAQEGEVRQELIESGVDERTARRASATGAGTSSHDRRALTIGLLTARVWMRCAAMR